ncbi:MAG: GTPase [bacterium]|nr:GTPase [bacterium]
MPSLPVEICQLKQLRHLYISTNQLTTLPPKISQLTHLEELDLRTNQLTTLPPELAYLTRLKGLRLAGNPNLSSPPPEIVAQGRKAVLAYLRERLDGSRRLWVSKLLIVGEGGVGKTSLLRALLGEAFDPQESTTHGIEIRSLPLAHPTETGVGMKLTTWDFGGQEIYHATHQFFLTNRSLFVLAWNARLGYEQGKLYYWLDTIKALAPESPVLLVATHIDQRDATLPLTELRRQYPQIVGHREVSNLDGTGLEEVRSAIAEAAADLPLMGELWPTTWLEAAEAVRAAAEKHVTPERLRAIFTDRGVADVSFGVLARWLHELGDVLYFQDDPELRDLVILKPQWVTGYISRVLESEDVIGRLGIFTREHMDALWSDLERPMRDHFLNLMERFDLSYKTLEDRDISLVVERLPLDPPELEPQWEAIAARAPCHEIAMRFELSTVPAGIPTWFIARSHRFTTRTHWRSGALFADGRDHQHLALARAFAHQRFVELTVRGPNPHNFFALLQDGLELTLGRFPGLKIRRQIPCPGHDGEPCPHRFDYEQLLKRVHKKPTIECPESFADVPVAQLLFGLHWSTQDVVLSRLDELGAAVEGSRAEILAELADLRELTQRQFTRAFRREQSKIDSHCPNVFALRPRSSGGWPEALAGRTVELRLYCQAPGQWHPALDDGRYEIAEPAKWLKSMAPYVARLVRVMKYATPLLAPVLGETLPGLAEAIKNDLALMNELVKLLPEIPEGTAPELARTEDAGPGEPGRAEGAALRVLRDLLDEQDPRKGWGGLRKILSPEGHYLWLCEKHAALYAR